MTNSLVEALRTKTNTIESLVFGDAADRANGREEALQELEAESIVEAIEDTYDRLHDAFVAVADTGERGEAGAVRIEFTH